VRRVTFELKGLVIVVDLTLDQAVVWGPPRPALTLSLDELIKVLSAVKEAKG
jgi:hypothetical protein